MRMRYPRHSNIGPAEIPEGSCELVEWCKFSQQWCNYILAKDNKSRCYKAGLPKVVYTLRVYPRVLSCICVFFVTAMHA